VNFAARNVRHLWIKHRGEGAQNAAFCLSTQSEKNKIMARENRVHDLRNHGVVVSNDAGKYRAAFAQSRHQIFAQFIFDPACAQSLFSEGTSAQFAESPGKTHGGNPQIENRYADYTAVWFAALLDTDSDERCVEKDTLPRTRKTEQDDQSVRQSESQEERGERRIYNAN
jgi:hypothetical protein